MKNTILVVALALAVANASAEPPADRLPPPGPAGDFTPAVARELKELGFILPREKVKAPGFSLKDLGGATRSLSDFRGKVVLLNFWGVWCYYCRLEMPSLQRFFDRFQAQGLEIVAVDVQDTEQTARQFIIKNKYTFPVLFDRDNKAVAQYEPRGFPTTYLIDREGNLQAMLVGARDWDTPEVSRTFGKILAVP
jgi:peroxiredoxin